MTQTPKKPQQSNPMGEQPTTRRAQARWQREQARQRRVVLISTVAIGLALIAVLVGLAYDQLWTPSRAVAQVNGTTLTRRDYWQERRNEVTRSIVQSIRLLGMFGDQMAQQFVTQLTTLNQQLETVRTAPVDDATVQGWIDRQLILQNAASEFQIQASDGEVAQALVNDLAPVFPPPPPPPTSTATLTPTVGVTTTVSVTPTGTIPPTATPTPLPSPTATSSQPTETPTPSPTIPPTATPLAEQAVQQQEELLGRVYDAYVNQTRNSNLKNNLQIEDIKVALFDEYLRQVVTEKVQERLVPEEGFQLSTEPSSIAVRHILIKVTLPISPTDTEREAAYAERKSDADAILAKLKQGTDFVTLAKEQSEDFSSKEQGGELPSFDKEGKTDSGGQIDPAFLQAALALKEPGDISELVRTPFGWHVIQLIRRTVPSKEEQLSTARTKAFDEWLEKQRAKANIERYWGLTPSPTPEPTVATTPLPLPTVPLGGEPTAAVITDTTTLTDTAPLTGTVPLTDTTPLTDTVPLTSTTSLQSPTIGTPSPTTTIVATARATSSPGPTATPAGVRATTTTTPRP